MIIREANEDDHEVLLGFEQKIIEAERPFDVSLKESPITYYSLSDLILNDKAVVLVAEEKGKLIASGYALIRESELYVKEPFHAYLGFMYVVPEYRGRSINGQILRELMKWAKSKGLREIKLDVYAENLPALRAYEKMGFKSRLLEMRLNLDETELLP